MIVSLKCGSCYSPKVSVSGDFKIAICTDEGLYIFEIRTDPTHKDQNHIIYKYVIPLPGDVNEFDTGKTRQALQRDLNHSELFQLMLDRTLSPSMKCGQTFRAYRSAYWSPMGVDPLDRSVLAALTMDHRLTIYSLGDSNLEWNPVVELSNVLFNKMQAKQFKLSDECEADECLLEEYKREIFSLAAVDMCWSKLYNSKKISAHSCDPKKPRLDASDKSDEAKFLLLCVLMRNGVVAIWKAKCPCLSSDCFSLMSMFDAGVGSPRCVYWCDVDESSGFLVIGSTLGHVVTHTVQISEKKEDFLIGSRIALWTEEDRLAVRNLEWLKEHKILLASKESHMVAFVLGKKNLNFDSLYLIKKQTCSGKFTKFISSIVSHGNDVFLSSIDGSVQVLNITRNNGEISFKFQRLAVPRDTRQWKCHGVCLSPNKMYAITCDSPAFNYDHLLLKENVKINIFKIQTTDVIVNKVLELHSDNCLRNKTDLLECIRQLRLQSDALHDKLASLITNQRDLNSRNTQSLHLIRYLVKLEETKSKSLKERCADTGGPGVKETNIIQVLFTLHIQSALNDLPHHSHTLSTKEVTSVNLMCALFEKNDCDRLSSVSMKQTLAESRKRAGAAASETCLICDQPFPVESFSKAECPNGHTFARCCQTFLACQELPYRRCSSCPHLSISKNKTDSWFTGFMSNYCTVCGSVLI